ncbi:MAG TPA: hypothetical protein VF223_08920 [Trebonia sp.]
MAVPLYPEPELCSFTGSDAFSNVPLGPTEIVVVITGQPLEVQVGAALHLSSQW